MLDPANAPVQALARAAGRRMRKPFRADPTARFVHGALRTPEAPLTAPAPPPFEIFAVGRHTEMGGDTLSFADADLTATAAAYDPAKHEAPICVGHPQHNLPAYGWIAGITAEGGRLLATPRQVNPAFAEMVRAGSFKKVSAAFWSPDAPGNPTPGVYALRHVGFLGAQPPAVKGLAPVQFAADDDGVVVFGDLGTATLGFTLRSVLGFLARIRDTLVERDGVEKANQVISDWELRSAQEAAARLEADTHGAIGPCCSDPVTDPATTHDEVLAVTTKPGASADDLAAREARLAAQEAAFAERETGARRQEDAAFLDRLVKEGRFAPGLTAETLAFMEHLDASGVVAFAEGGEKTPHVAFRDLLGRLPKVVEFGEIAPGDDDRRGVVAFAAPGGCEVDRDRLAIHVKALAYQQQHPGTDYAAAVRAAGGI